MTALTPDEYAAAFMFDLTLADMGRERSRQSDARQIGVSDLGVCHEQTRRMLVGEPDSDVTPRLAAMMGTWIDAGVKEARKASNPDLITDGKVTVTLPSGLVLEGHPDEIDLEEPSCSDIKTVNYDGLAYIRKNHSSDHHRFQRHLYGLGVVQSGLVEAKDLIVRNIYVDRSGKDDHPHVEQELLSAAVIAEADDWYRDVLYAIENGEEASKDKPVSWCRRFCQFATACRGLDLPTQRFDQPDLIQAALTYHEAQATGAVAERERKAAKQILVDADVNGIAGPVRVRKSWVNPTEHRVGYYNVTTELLPAPDIPGSTEQEAVA